MTSTPIPLALAVLLTPAALVIGLVRPTALVVLILLAVFAAVLARVGLWLLDDRDAQAADAQALRAGAGVFAGSVTVAAILLVLGPASVPVMAVLAVVFAATVAIRLRHGTPAL